MPLEQGQEVEGKVTGIAPFGAFIELPEKETGLVHISQVSETYIKDINQHLKVGDAIKVKVLGIGKNGKYDLSIKQVGKEFGNQQNYKLSHVPKPDHPQSGTLEYKITHFLKQSEERLLDVKKNVEKKQGIRKRNKVRPKLQ